MKTTENLRNLACLAFLLALILTLASCGREPRYPRQLLVADSLTNVNRPHDADSLLRSYRDTAMKAAEPIRMYYQLLRMRTDDKLADFPKNDSLALALVDYYEHKGDKRLLPKAYYYAGRTYMGLYDEPQALAFFYKASEALEKHEDNSIDSQVFAQIGLIFQEQHLPAMALPYYRKALAIDSLDCDTEGVVFDYRDIAYQYHKLGNDSALLYYELARKLAKVKNIAYLYRSVNMCIASFLLSKNQPKKAHQYIKISLKDTYKEEMGSTYIIAGRIYDDLGMTDSASFYFNKVLEIGTCYGKESAYWRLSKIAQRKGDFLSSMKYLEEYRRQNDSVKAINHAEAVVHAQAMYNYQLQEKARFQAERNNERKRRIIVFLTSSLLLSIFLLFAIIQWYKTRKTIFRLRLQEIRSNFEKKEKENMELVEKNNKQIEKLNKELQKAQNNLEISRIENEKLLLMAENVKVRRSLDARNCSEMKIRKSPIFNKMKDYIRENDYAREEDYRALVSVINEVYPTFIKSLTQAVNMNIQDFRVSILLKAGFKPLEISVLTIHSPQSVSTTRKRLYKKTFGEDGAPSQWDVFIKQFE